jgi:sialate O-acetylesterase
LQAENLVYGDRKTIASGPMFKSVVRDHNKLILSFDYVGKGLMAKGSGELKYFSIAGADKKFVWAKATIKGDKIIVWSDEITAPIYIRYAWADNPQGANLYNKEGLPTGPFEGSVK